VIRTRFHTRDRQLFSRHRTKFSRWGHLARCICVPLVSALRVGQVCDVISPSVIAASWTASRYVVSLLLLSASQPRQPTGPSEPCVSLCSFCNYTSQQLAVRLRRIFLQGTLQYCSALRSAQMFVLRTVLGQHCVQTARVTCEVAGTRWQRCAAVAVYQGAGGLRRLSV
jgi:hypothetical protein